ncbi:MAG TPA: MBL fold metallo-hydrolase [Terriglobia bacterium]|jgi:glyoxylase-like metal-dependent hydrolase (beta-lactamase superfamily II)
MADIRFYHDFTFEYDTLEAVSPLIRRIVARNPGPFTGAGTSTYVIGHGRVALVDPGPALASHVEAILGALRGEKIEHILITHTHSDHWPAAAAIQRATGAQTYGFRPDAGEFAASGAEVPDYGFVPDRPLRDGDVVDGPGWHLTALHTPGHASDHLCFALAEERALLSGDHVMGWSTSVIIPPDGELRAYLRSLERLLHRDDVIYLPAHGPVIPDPKPHVSAFLEHRRERTAAILRRLDSGNATVPEIVQAVYVGLSSGLRWAAAQSVLAHLIELVRLGEVECDSTPGLDQRYRLARARPRK